MSEPWLVGVFPKTSMLDILAQELESLFQDFNVQTSIRSIKLYQIETMLTYDDLNEICKENLVDSIENDFLIGKGSLQIPNRNNSLVLKTMYKDGVMDAEGLSVKHTIELLDYEIHEVRTGFIYIIKSSADKADLEHIIKSSFVNELIQDYTITHFEEENLYSNPIPLISLSKEELLQLNKELMLALNKNELLTIQKYYLEELKRNPTDIELETLAQTWSEHCIHKTFTSTIHYKNKVIDNLLKTYIKKATEEIQVDWCFSVFDDNAGIIEFIDNYGLAVKVETHNHPTALDPYGGAGTGSGGVFRDAMGVGARPCLATDNLFFGPLDIPLSQIPEGTMHPKRLMKGSVAGIRDYGNKMGIPTANGSVNFHENYLGNPLVFAGVVGILPLDRYVRDLKSGDLIVVIGGRTGRDGIHGVTFASGTLTSESEKIASSAVQIGNPLEQKRVLDALLVIRDYNDSPLYSAITDCGGGGLSSAVGEMGKNSGVNVDLEKVPLKYQGLRPWEIWISESQERMLLAVPPENLDKLKEICMIENCEATVIGEFTDTRKLILNYQGEKLCDLDMTFLHEGVPKIIRTAEDPSHNEYIIDKTIEENDFTSDLKLLLQHPNIASKEWVIRQYDHEVQANTIIKPLQGIECDGHGDACVIKPLEDVWKGFVVSSGFNVNYSNNPRKMALSSIDESIRNNISVGGRRFALLDNFSWGSPENPKALGALIEACKACYDYATVIQSPFISGKDSLYNDFLTKEGKLISIPHTLLITCVGIIPDVRNSITSDFKKEGNAIYLIGDTKHELGGSLFYKNRKIEGGIIPDVKIAESKKIFLKMIEAIDEKLIHTCHDCSEGGLAVTLAEMCFGGNLGAEIDLNKIKSTIVQNYILLFSESNTRFVVEVSETTLFEKLMKDVPISKIGSITGSNLAIKGLNGKLVIFEDVKKLKIIWQSTFQW